MLTDRQKVERARQNGIRQPHLALRAARYAGISYWAACAFLMQETSGGRNIYGHDGGEHHLFYGHGQVTPENYRAYKIERDRTGQRQGVGPLQLTSATFQDAADELGGAHIPFINMLVAFQWMADRRAEGSDWHEVALRYNGAESYADQMDQRFAEWREILEVNE